MVWSEQIGSSITVPSDWVPGDTRNHMTIGQDVPAEIADQFTAVFSWWNGNFSGNPNDDFPNGFKYWALGISKSGTLELVAYYYVVSAPTSGGYSFYRQTLFSSAPPVGVDNPPVLSIGYDPNYATYGEGVLAKVLISNQLTQLAPLVAAGPFPGGPNVVAYGSTPVYQTPRFRKDITGRVQLEGLLAYTGTTLVNQTRLGTLPVGCRPAFTRIFACAGGNDKLWRCQIDPQGNVYFWIALSSDWSFTPGVNSGYLSIDGISFYA